MIVTGTAKLHFMGTLCFPLLRCSQSSQGQENADATAGAVTSLKYKNLEVANLTARSHL